MKIRNGFVSNSSSSSFIVYTKSLELDKDTINLFLSYCKKSRYEWSDRDHVEITLPLEKGNIDFNGSFEEYTTFEDRINYIAETLIYHMYNHGRLDEVYQEMEDTLYKSLNDVIKERWGDVGYLSINFDYNRGLEGDIGHSSTNKWVDEAFKSTKAMKNFLFGKDSKVEDGNDYYTGPNEEDCPMNYSDGYKFMKRNIKWFKENLFLSEEENREYRKRLISDLKMEKYILERKIEILEEANKE